MASGQPRYIALAEVNAEDRKVWFDLRTLADAIVPATAEAGGQPQISINSATFVDAGIGTLVHIGNGKYTAELTAASVSGAVGDYIKTRYKSANTVETPGEDIFVVPNAPETDFINAISASLVTSLSGAVGIIVIPTTSQQITLDQAVEFARVAIRDTADDSIQKEGLREMVRTVVSDFLNRTNINSTVADFTPTIGDPMLNLSTLAGFRAERFLRAQIGFKPPLLKRDYATVSCELEASEANATPLKIAFDAVTTAFVSPRPDATTTIKIKYRLAATALENDSDLIQIPVEYLKPALIWGIPAFYRSAGQEGDEGNAAWLRYLDVVRIATGYGESNIGNLQQNVNNFL